MKFFLLFMGFCLGAFLLGGMVSWKTKVEPEPIILQVEEAEEVNLINQGRLYSPEAMGLLRTAR